MSKPTSRQLELPAPRTVEGFAQAAQAGQIPHVPAQPPTRAADELTPTSSSVFRTTIVRMIGSGCLVAAIVVGVDHYAHPFALPLVALVVGVAGFKLVPKEMSKPMYRLLEETRRGYATSTVMFGNVGGHHYSAWTAMEVGMPWSFAGVWVLDAKFQIRSAPDLTVDPPGFYPSPHEPGKWELWSGVVWSGTYRSEPFG